MQRAKLAKRVLWTMKRARFGAAVKIFKANAAEYFGHRKSLRLREQTAGVRKLFFQAEARFLLVTKEMGYYSFYFSGFSLILIQPN